MKISNLQLFTLFGIAMLLTIQPVQTDDSSAEWMTSTDSAKRLDATQPMNEKCSGLLPSNPQDNSSPLSMQQLERVEKFLDCSTQYLLNSSKK